MTLPTKRSAMLIAEIQERVERFTYKPGWEFEVFPDPLYNAVQIVARVTTLPNSRLRPGEELPFLGAAYVSVGAGRSMPLTGLQLGDVDAMVIDIIHIIEEHEQKEWLRFDGELLDDPHAADWART